jgi:hypothetical protein
MTNRPLNLTGCPPVLHYLQVDVRVQDPFTWVSYRTTVMPSHVFLDRVR